jgi:hypothetical protein
VSRQQDTKRLSLIGPTPTLELLETHGEELSMEDLEERAEQLSREDTEESEADPAMSVRTLTVKSMQEAIALIATPPPPNVPTKKQGEISK